MLSYISLIPITFLFPAFNTKYFFESIPVRISKFFSIIEFLLTDSIVFKTDDLFLNDSLVRRTSPVLDFRTKWYSRSLENKI